MKFVKTMLVASGLAACGILSALAQTSSDLMSRSPAATDTIVSSSTHCRDANGHIKLKSAKNGFSSSSTSTLGSSGTVGSASANSGTLRSGSEGTTAASLPSCRE
jgi:hypothetical protein